MSHEIDIYLVCKLAATMSIFNANTYYDVTIRNASRLGMHQFIHGYRLTTSIGTPRNDSRDRHRSQDLERARHSRSSDWASLFSEECNGYKQAKHFPQNSKK
jgi:hypothetical protein